jgi:hypothetical protein
VHGDDVRRGRDPLFPFVRGLAVDDASGDHGLGFLRDQTMIAA